jgi:hypothetical protein
MMSTPSNRAVNASHSGFTALAQKGKRRAAGRAGYAQRWASRSGNAKLS